MSIPPAVLQPLCSAPCTAQNGTFSQNVWLYSILRVYMALTSLPVESSSYKLWPYRGKVQNNIWAKFILTACSNTWHADMVKGRELPHTSSGWLCAQLACVYTQILFQSSKYKVCSGIPDHTHSYCKESPDLLGNTVCLGSLKLIVSNCSFWENFRIIFILKEQIGENK